MASITSMAAALSSLFTSVNCSNASLTILIYDWLLCLDQEFACVWKLSGGLNAGSLVYALSRFPLMINLVLAITTIFPLPRLSCHFVAWVQNVCVLFPRFAILVFSALRVYAVSGRKIAPTLIVSLLSAVTIVDTLIVYSRFTMVEILPSPFNCSAIVSLSPQWSLRITMISRIPLIAAEAIVVAITWQNRIKTIERDQETLGTVLLRDGSLYFIVLGLLNVLHIVMTAVSIDTIDDNSSYVTLFIDPISSVLTCRFILNLRNADNRRMPSTMSSGGDVEFAAQGSRGTLPRFIASFGEPLHAPPVGSAEEDEMELGEMGECSGSTDGFSRAQAGVDISV